MRKISIITPCYNEADNVKNCIDTVAKMMADKLPDYSYEHIFTDNASTDSTVQIIKEHALHDERIILTVNSRNVGPFRNIWNGLTKSSGDLIIPMLPADLQDPPSVIPEFVKKWEEGYLIVYGVRKNRQESILMRSIRSAYYRAIQKLADFHIPRDAGEFMAIDRSVAKSLLMLKDEYPYIRGLVAQVGVKSSQVNYTWVKRYSGKSKNSLLNLVDQGVNGLISTSKVPARLALASGFVISLLSIVYAIVQLIVLSINRNGAQIGIPTLIVSIMFFAGIQLLFLGLIGEYVLSIHNQVRPGPPMYEIDSMNLNSESK